MTDMARMYILVRTMHSFIHDMVLYYVHDCSAHTRYAHGAVGRSALSFRLSHLAISSIR
jgi:hypothetical protein